MSMKRYVKAALLSRVSFLIENQPNIVQVTMTSREMERDLATVLEFMNGKGYRLEAIREVYAGGPSVTTLSCSIEFRLKA